MAPSSNATRPSVSTSFPLCTPPSAQLHSLPSSLSHPNPPTLVHHTGTTTTCPCPPSPPPTCAGLDFFHPSSFAILFIANSFIAMPEARFFYAAKSNDLRTLQSFLARGADVDSRAVVGGIGSIQPRSDFFPVPALPDSTAPPCAYPPFIASPSHPGPH